MVDIVVYEQCHEDMEPLPPDTSEVIKEFKGWVEYCDHKKIVEDLKEELGGYKAAYIYYVEHVALLNS